MCQKTHAPLESYEVNRSTIAVLPEEIDGKMGSKVIEKDCILYVSMKPIHIIDRSCRYFGSSYAGEKREHMKRLKFLTSRRLWWTLQITSFYSLHFLLQGLNAAGYRMCTLKIFNRRHLMIQRSRSQTAKRWNWKYPIILLKIRFTEPPISEPLFRTGWAAISRSGRNSCCIRKKSGQE